MRSLPVLDPRVGAAPSYLLGYCAGISLVLGAQREPEECALKRLLCVAAKHVEGCHLVCQLYIDGMLDKVDFLPRVGC